MNYQIRLDTTNAKLGKASVITLDRDTCPDDCPLKKNGCYADNHGMNMVWDRVSRGEAKHDGKTRFAGSGFDHLHDTIFDNAHLFPEGSLLRVGDAGDPSEDGVIPLSLLLALGHLKAARGVDSIVYTHAKPEHNVEALRWAEDLGVTVNFSSHSLADTEGVNATIVVPEDFWDEGDSVKTEHGTVVRCPAETKGLTCDDCRLCARPRNTIGFTAHGSRRKKAAETFQES